MAKSNSYLRARVKTLLERIKDAQETVRNGGRTEEDLKAWNDEIVILRNGVFPRDEADESFIAQNLRWKDFSDEPLSFLELTSFNTFFILHPEKMAGKEIVSSSRDFKIRIEGNKEDIIRCIEAGLEEKGTAEMSMEDEMREMEKALKSYKAKAEGLSGLDGLGDLGEFIKSEINSNLSVVRDILKQVKEEKEYKPTDKLSFEDVVRLYNSGITEDEIRAWVWYKRSLGVPMTGWEKYYLPSTGGHIGEMLITIQDTVIKDNHFRDIRTVKKGIAIGKPTGKKLEYSKTDTYLIYRDNEGLKYVNSKDVKLEKTSVTTDPKALQELFEKGFLFYLDGEYLPYPVYAYGNMYDRELQLENDKSYLLSHYSESVYQKHKEVIEKAKPRLLSIFSPDPKDRPRILAISEFAQDFLIEELREDTGIFLKEKTSLLMAFKPYLDSLGRDQFRDSNGFDIWQYYISGRRITDDDLKPEQRQEIKANARNEGEELFGKFLYEALTFKDQERLNVTWNRLYNGQSGVAHHKIPIGFECSAKFKQYNLQIRPAQREGIAFMESVGSGTIAYDVGVGKTLTAIVTLAQAMYSGKCKRPLIVVPNGTYKKWIEEIIGSTDKKSGTFVPGILSNIGLKVNEWYNLGSDMQKGIDLLKKLPEKSITVVTYEGFKRIGFSDSVMDEMLTELVNILEQSSVEVSERDKEIEYQKYREKIGVGVKDTVCDIDTLGIDYIVIDEAHRCKNIFDRVKTEEKGPKRYGLESAVSETGQKTFFLCNYIQRRWGRNVMLLTATPFTNSPLEIYSMLSLIAYHALKELNIYNIKQFFDLFVQETSEFVVNYKEEIVRKDVVKSFNNLYILQRLLYNHILYKTGEEAGVVRPCKVNLPRVNMNQNGVIKRLAPSEQILTYLRMTDGQRNNQNAINEMAREATLGRLNKGKLFKALNYSLDNALSPFLFSGYRTPDDYLDFVEGSPKLHYTLLAIKSVKLWHEARGESISGQIIYLNRGKQFFPLIKEYLEKEIGYKSGVKWGNVRVDEVEYITSEISGPRKENVKEAFLAGVVKIIIGTATIREGIDLQKYGTVIYDCYPDWNPTDIKQLEGRIWRQGNTFGYVRFVLPLIQDSMDVFVFQKLEEKTSRINDLWFRGDRGNVLDMEALDPEEVKFALLTDIEALSKMRIKQQIADIKRKLDILNINIEALRGFSKDYAQYQHFRELVLNGTKYWNMQIASHPYIKNPPGEEVLSQYDKNFRDDLEKDIALLEELSIFLSAPIQEDKELVRISRKLSNKIVFNHYNFEHYKEFLSKVKKAEKSILKPKGYSSTDNIEKIIEEFTHDRDSIEVEITRLESEEYFNQVKREVEEKKSTLKVEGKTVEQRADDFAKLNYLLSFKAHDMDSGSCMLPGESAEKPAAKHSINIDEMELELMEMELLLLNYKAA